MIYNTEATYTAEFLREFPLDELDTLLEDARKTQLALRTIAQSSEIKKPHLFKRMGRDIARILTVQREGHR